MRPINELLQTLRHTGFDIATGEVIQIHELLAMADSYDELRLGIRMLISNSKQEQDLFDFIWQLYEPYNPTKVSQIPDIGDLDGSELMTLPLELPQGATDAEYCPNPGAISAGMVGSNDPSIALIRFASDLKGPAKQMIQGNYRNAAFSPVVLMPDGALETF